MQGVKVLIRGNLVRSAPKRRFIAHTTLWTRIAVVVMVPGFDENCIRAMVADSSKENPFALVLQLYGSGQFRCVVVLVAFLLNRVCIGRQCARA